MSTLWAVSDLHVSVPANWERLADIQPHHPRDWLIVAGDVAENPDTVFAALDVLAPRFDKLLWVPGNHELFAQGDDPTHGKARYRELIRGCRERGIITPEDTYPRFGDLTVCPLFTLYDYTYRPAGLSHHEALDLAHTDGTVLADEYLIAPYVDIPTWCAERLLYTSRRLGHLTGPTVLINHWPLTPEPLARLHLPILALWSGSKHTRSWPRRYHAQAVVYGHLHIPADDQIDTTRHHEVSLGYPRQWRRRPPAVWPAPIAERGDH